MKLYVVHAGDSLAAIADKNSTTVDVLRGLNNGVDDSHLYEGMKLKIDGGALPIKTGMRSEKLKVKWHHQQPAPAVQSSVSPKQAQQQVQSVVAPTTQKPAAAADAGVVKEKQPVMPVAQPKLNWAYAPQVSAPINPMSAGTQPSTVSPATAGNGSA
ncbi:MAG: LysM domain-containing protein, partial [Sporolactobacillus sp.]